MAAVGQEITTVSKSTRQLMRVKCISISQRDKTVTWQSHTGSIGVLPVESWDQAFAAQEAVEDNKRKADGLEAYIKRIKEENDQYKEALEKIGQLTAYAERMKAYSALQLVSPTHTQVILDLLEIRRLATLMTGNTYKGKEV